MCSLICIHFSFWIGAEDNNSQRLLCIYMHCAHAQTFLETAFSQRYNRRRCGRSNRRCRLHPLLVSSIIQLFRLQMNMSIFTGLNWAINSNKSITWPHNYTVSGRSNSCCDTPYDHNEMAMLDRNNAKRLQAPSFISRQRYQDNLIGLNGSWMGYFAKSLWSYWYPLA